MKSNGCPFNGGPVEVTAGAMGANPNVLWITHSKKCETLTDVDDFLESLQADPRQDSAPMPLEGWPSPAVSRLGMREVTGWYGGEPVTRLKPELREAIDAALEWCECP